MRPIEQTAMYLEDRISNVNAIRQDKTTRQAYKSLQNAEDSFTRQIQREELKGTPGLFNKLRLYHDQRAVRRADNKLDRLEMDALKSNQRTIRDAVSAYEQAERRSLSSYRAYPKADYSNGNLNLVI